MHDKFLNFQLNTHVYLQEGYGDRVEFPVDDWKLDIGNYVEGHDFTINGSGEWQTPNTQSTSVPVSSTPASSRAARGIREECLATLKIIRVDLGSNGKPTNMNYHNLTSHINLYVEEGVCITNGANCLVILDQEATRGNPKPKIFELVYRSFISLV